MHGDMHLPPKAKKLSELLEHIEAWERQLERYYDGGAGHPAGREVRHRPEDSPDGHAVLFGGAARGLHRF